MKKTSLTIAALAAVALTQAPAGAQNTPNTVTLAAAPTVVTFGTATTLSGQVTGAGNAGVKVDLEQDGFPYDGAKNAGMTVNTDASGNYTFSVKPELNTRYTVSAKAKPQVSSAVVEVKVRTALTLAVNDATARRGQRITFTGAVTPVHTGVVLLQRRIGSGSFRTIARPTLVNSAFTHTARVRRTAVYRVRMAAHTDHATGTSAKRRVRVR
jgi:hypothetical protein